MALSIVLSKVALKLIKKFGRSATLETKSDADYNPDIGATSSTVSTTIQIFASNYKTNDYKEGLINMGDLPIYTTSKVQKNSTLIIGEVPHTITFVESFMVNDSTVLYYANARSLGA